MSTQGCGVEAPDEPMVRRGLFFLFLLPQILLERQMLSGTFRWPHLAISVGLACSSVAAMAADPVKIGLLEDASGNFALATIPKIHATQLAVDEINAKGGIMGRPILLISYDTQSDNTKFQEYGELQGL